jgi:general stress protein YciG
MSKHLRKNKAAFVRSCPLRMSARTVVERGRQLHGLTFDEAFVERVRERAAKTQRRGFKAMDREVVADIGRIGGIVSHARGKGHEFSHEEAVRAGRKSARVRKARKLALAKHQKRQASRKTMRARWTGP